jgi:DNA adenine methylase
MKNKYNKSPMNYIGAKTKLLPQILPLFPSKINNFVDLFCGGCTIGINLQNAKNHYYNDSFSQIIEIYKSLTSFEIDYILEYIDSKIKEYNLTILNKDEFYIFRDYYNSQENKNPLDLFILLAFSFNHDLRFNSEGVFNQTFGYKKSHYNPVMKNNLIEFHKQFKERNPTFSNKEFTKFDFSFLKEGDFVYCDPPYLITNANYNKSWASQDEMNLLTLLKDLDNRNIKVALSNVIEHKGRSNDFLKKFIGDNENFKVHYLDKNYDYSNFGSKDLDKGKTVEVLITNY